VGKDHRRRHGIGEGRAVWINRNGAKHFVTRYLTPTREGFDSECLASGANGFSISELTKRHCRRNSFQSWIGRYGRLQRVVMISNERPSPFGGRPYSQPKPPVNEETLKSGQVQIERKTFIFTLKENPRGRFLRITEDVGGRRDNIIIPAPGLEDFKKLLDEMVKAAGELSAKQA